MSENITGFGTTMVLAASTTFPAGFSITQLADDADPLDVPEMSIADSAMGVNGTLVVWARAARIEAVIAVVPNGNDDRNLALLLETNRVSQGKRSARDVITLTVAYPDGRTKVFQQGVIVAGQVANSVSSAGRYKTRTYRFHFENVAGT